MNYDLKKVPRYKTLFDNTLKQAKLNFEEENYIRNAKEARDKFKEKDFYKYLTYFTDQKYLDKFEECLNKALKRMSHATFTDTKVELIRTWCCKRYVVRIKRFCWRYS